MGVIRSLSKENPLILCSGDIFNPSILSKQYKYEVFLICIIYIRLGTVTRGKHMVPVLNEYGTQCAVVGNHDFDFGVRFTNSTMILSHFLAKTVINDVGILSISIHLIVCSSSQI